MRQALLTCGILSSLLYIGMNVFVPPLFEGYSYASHTVSELSAIGAPTRRLWVALASFYILLFFAFSIGVWQLRHQNRFIQIIGVLMLIYSVVNFYWPPMHLRGNEPTLTDVLHIVWAGATILLMLLIMGFGAFAFGKSFRFYTASTIAIHIVFGVLTSLEAPNIAVNGPTPWIGVWERINIAAFMIWIMVLSIVLLRMEKSTVLIRRSEATGRA